MNDPAMPFDRRQVRRQRERAAARLEAHDFLLREVAARLAERLDDVRRRFPTALDLGCRGGELARALAGRGGIETLVAADLSEELARRAGGPAVVADEEALPFSEGAFDLVVSSLSLHWVNDLPGTLIQIRRTLRPDGLFLAAMFGGETLHELRSAFLEAEAALEGGAGPRVAPFADVRDMGGLLQRAGFALPVVDRDEITVRYADPLSLMADLRAMGEGNALAGRRRSFTRRGTLLAAAERYRDRFATADGRVPATFQVLYLTAWAPHESQPRPLRPGSGRVSLADVLGRGSDGSD